MLQQFSWGQFLIAASLLSVLWYLFVGLLFFRKELMAFSFTKGGESRGKEPGVDPGNSAGGDGFRDIEIEREVDAALMGRSRLPGGLEVRGSDELSFASSLAHEDSRYSRVGLIADVVQELKLIFAELEKGAGDKRDFFRLLERVKEQYGPLGGHPSVGALTAFIAEHASFHLGTEELENLWY